MAKSAKAMSVMQAALGCCWGPPEVDRKAGHRGFRDQGLPRLRDFVTGFIARHGGGAKGREARGWAAQSGAPPPRRAGRIHG